MLWLSELLMKSHDLDSFEALKTAVKERARAGEIHLGMDARPPFKDTPADWEDQLEAAFYSRQ
ncbi:MAG: hypothetical protein ACFCUG_01480 [Thiotrichales bacterium]